MQVSPRVLFLSIGCLGLASIVRGQYVDESFNYTQGDNISSQAGPYGTGVTSWSGGSTATIGAGLSYSGYASANNGLVFSSETNATANITGFPGAGTLYASFLVNAQSTGTYGGFVYGNVFTGFDDLNGGDLGSTTSGGNLGGSNGNIEETPLVNGNTYLFVIQDVVTQDGSGYDNTATTWYGVNGASTLTQTGTSFTQIGLNAGNFESFLLATNYEATFDEVRIGTSLDSVAPGISIGAVPEPSTYALFGGLAAVGMIGLRDLRRRRTQGA